MIATPARPTLAEVSTPPGWLGAPPCRDLALGVVGTFLLRAGAAVVDPLASPFQERLHLVLAAVILVVLVSTLAAASTGRLSTRALVAPDRVPRWAQPGGALTLALVAFLALASLLAVLALLDDTLSLIGHASNVASVIYVGLGLRVQWAAATGRMATPVPVRPPSRRLRRAALGVAMTAALAVAAMAIAAPFIVARDRKTAACRNNDAVHSDAQTAIGELHGEPLQRRIEELARRLEPCA